MLNITEYQKNANHKTAVNHHSIPMRITIIKNKCWRGCGINWNSCIASGNVTAIKTAMEDSMEVPQKFENRTAR